MRVLLVAEGDHELGKEDSQPGALEQLVRRVYDGNLQCDRRKVSDPKVRIHIHPGKGSRYFKRAVAWLREAERRGYDALIMVIDQDDQPERIQQLTKAQHEDIVSLRRALGVAIRTFDAWMLADKGALTSVLAYTVSQQPSPEGIRNPKEKCTKLLNSSEVDMSQSEFYAAVANEAKIETLKKRCPKGFAQFVERVRSL